MIRPSVVVTNKRFCTPEGVVTASRNTGAPSAVAGRLAWYFCTSEATLPGVRMVSAGLLPLCCGLPPNCSQSYADAGAIGSEHTSAHRHCVTSRQYALAIAPTPIAHVSHRGYFVRLRSIMTKA